ncbi:MAG: peptidase dimerization domain-containing protein, partial [Clostridia bacterium]|nr:peptidase dimerization domain-containing protein [Clostridia bacterium]
MAEGTTLGADNGVAVALMLTVLADKSLEAPALECLFTVQEETGLGGAEFFDYSKLSARRIINLDTESESEAIASCAGSMNLSFKIAPDYLPFKNQSIKVTVKGLAGGHSGTDIDSGRRNSIMLLGQLLSAYYEVTPFNLVSLEGGNKRKAIPRESEAIISVVDREEAIAQLKKLSSVYYPLLVEEDEGLKI